VPASAVRDGAVYVIESGKAIKRAVTTGSVNPAGEIEIRQGLIGGEILITHPPQQLTDGDPVKAADAPQSLE